MNLYKHGTPGVWKEVFAGVKTAYLENLDSQNRIFEKAKIDFLSEIFPKGRVRMLEAGCGSGYVSLYFAKRGYKTTLVDINPSILEIARENFRKEKVLGLFKVASVEKLPFADNSFDVVASFGLLEHFENPQKAIEEMVRVLTLGGMFFADIVPNRFSVQSLGNVFNFLASLVYGLVKLKPVLGWKKGVRNFRPLYFENSVSWQRYKGIIEKAGIKKVEVRGNRPVPRLTLPKILDRTYAFCLRPFLGLWGKFDRWDSDIPKFWRAGLWFWGRK